MKRILAMVLAAALAVSVFAGCNKDTGTSTSTSTGTSTSTSTDAGDAGDDTTDPSNPWADIMDYSKEENINIVVFGSEQPDHKRVVELANEELKKIINTTISIEFIALSDFATKYPLALTGGDDIDLIYASTWAFYNDNVNKGAFMELTDDFIAKYMPVTNEVQADTTYITMSRDGKKYVVPRNQAEDQSYGAWMIRSDIAEEFGYKEEDFKTVDDLKAFLLDLAGKGYGEQTGVFPWYCFPSLPMEGQILTCYLNWFAAGSMMWEAGTEAKAENLIYSATSPEQKAYVLEMAEFAKAGVWPSNAISMSTHTNDLFNEGKSVVAALRYQEAANAYQALEAKGLPAWYVNLQTDGMYTRPQDYTEGLAITAFSKNPERAAVVMDILKNYDPVHYLLLGGVEGEHYILQDDGTRIVGPKVDNYAWDNYGWSFRNDTDPKLDTYEPVKVVRSDLEGRKLPDTEYPWIGFSFDNTAVSTEAAVISATVSEYDYSFDLGVFGADTEATYDKYVAALYDAGLEKWIAEHDRQVNEFLASK